jgi:hypothetical protein
MKTANADPFSVALGSFIVALALTRVHAQTASWMFLVGKYAGEENQTPQ